MNFSRPHALVSFSHAFAFSLHALSCPVISLCFLSFPLALLHFCISLKTSLINRYPAVCLCQLFCRVSQVTSQTRDSSLPASDSIDYCIYVYTHIISNNLIYIYIQVSFPISSLDTFGELVHCKSLHNCIHFDGKWPVRQWSFAPNFPMIPRRLTDKFTSTELCNTLWHCNMM